MEETLKNIRALIAIGGAAMTLEDAVTWLEVKENATRLLNEHEPPAESEETSSSEPA